MVPLIYGHIERGGGAKCLHSLKGGGGSQNVLKVIGITWVL